MLFTSVKKTGMRIHDLVCTDPLRDHVMGNGRSSEPYLLEPLRGMGCGGGGVVL